MQASVADVAGVTGLSLPEARQLLEETGYDAEGAVNLFFQRQSSPAVSRGARVPVAGGARGGARHAAPRDAIAAWQSDDELQEAIARSMASSGGSAFASSMDDRVRAPEKEKVERLVAGQQRVVKATPVVNPFVLNQGRHAQLFAPPEDILHHGSFLSAREAALRDRKWLLVNIQDYGDFESQKLNRDVWANESMKTIVRADFVFWQQSLQLADMPTASRAAAPAALGNHNPHAQTFLEQYRIPDDTFPVIAIIDPRTRELLRLQIGFKRREQLQEILADFVASSSLDDESPIPVLYTCSHRPSSHQAVESKGSAHPFILPNVPGVLKSLGKLPAPPVVEATAHPSGSTGPSAGTNHSTHGHVLTVDDSDEDDTTQATVHPALPDRKRARQDAVVVDSDSDASYGFDYEDDGEEEATFASADMHSGPSAKRQRVGNVGESALRTAVEQAPRSKAAPPGALIAPSTTTEPPPSSDSVQVQLRMPNGQRIVRLMRSTDPVALLYYIVSSQLQLPHTIVGAYLAAGRDGQRLPASACRVVPGERFSLRAAVGGSGDSSMTQLAESATRSLADAGLSGATVVVEVPSSGAIGAGGAELGSGATHSAQSSAAAAEIQRLSGQKRSREAALATNVPGGLLGTSTLPLDGFTLPSHLNPPVLPAHSTLTSFYGDGVDTMVPLRAFDPVIHARSAGVSISSSATQLPAPRTARIAPDCPQEPAPTAGTTQVQLRMPNGQRVVRLMRSTDPVALLYYIVSSQLQLPHTIVGAYLAAGRDGQRLPASACRVVPGERFSLRAAVGGSGDSSMTQLAESAARSLADAGLSGATVVVEVPSSGAIGAGGAELGSGATHSAQSSAAAAEVQRLSGHKREADFMQV